jgi:hypothetical protein
MRKRCSTGHLFNRLCRHQMGGPRRRRSNARQLKARSHAYSAAPHCMARIADTFVAWLHLASVLPKTAGMAGYSVDDGHWAPASLYQRALSLCGCSRQKMAHSRKLAGAPGRVRTWGLTGREVAVSAGPFLCPYLTLPV